MLNVRVVSHAVPEDEVLVEERVLSLIEQLIPDDLLLYIFSFKARHSVGVFAKVGMSLGRRESFGNPHAREFSGRSAQVL